MNSIKGLLDKSDNEIYDDYINFLIDGCWLDEKLEELYPGNGYKGTVPTLLFWMEIEEERKLVWKRILPKNGEKTICPILMCPDDADFSCTIILAEIENTGSTIKWNKIGLDQTKVFEIEKIGTTVNWFEKVQPLEFKLNDYLDMINDFKKQFEIDKVVWEERKPKILAPNTSNKTAKNNSWWKNLWRRH